MANKKKTYADIADKLTKAIGKHEEAMKSGDKFAKATAEKMLPRLQSKLDKLFQAQEDGKQAAFQKEQAKLMEKFGMGGNLEYQNGGQLPPASMVDYKKFQGKSHHLDPDIKYLNPEDSTVSLHPYFTIGDRLRNTFTPKRQTVKPKRGTNFFEHGGYTYQEGGGTPPTFEEFLQSRPDLANFPESAREQVYKQHLTNQGFQAPEVVGAYNPEAFYENRGMTPRVDTQYTRNVAGDTAYADEQGRLVSNMDSQTLNFQGQEPTGTPNDVTPKTETDYSSYTASPYANTTTDDTVGGGNKFGDFLYGAATAAPTAYNIFQGLRKPQELQSRDFYNPYEGKALDLMSNMKYNIDPQLQANRRGFNQMSRNIAGASGGAAGSYLANIGAAQGRKQAADAQAYGTKQNIENQYRGALANAYGTFGQQRAATDLSIQDINDRNRAAKQQMLSSGLTGVSQLAQQNRYMSNLSEADKIRAKTLQGMYGGYGYYTDSSSGRPTGEMYYKDEYTG